MVDKNLILRKISELEKYLEQLKEFSAITLDEYKSDWKTQRIIERTLQIMIETCVDIANHIIADNNMRPPTSYADTFKVLSEKSVLNNELSDIMSRMTKFRNIVVHQYEKVDAGIVINILKKNLDDFLKYRESILGFLK